MDGSWYVFIQLTLYAANHTKKSFLKLGGWLSAGEAEERDGIKWFLIWSCFSVWCRGKTRWRTSLVELWLQRLHKEFDLLHFVAFFHVASLLSTGKDNEKVGVDNEKALELTNSTVFHRGGQWKSSRAGQQNIFFNKEILPKNATKHPLALCSGISKPKILVTTWFFVA